MVAHRGDIWGDTSPSAARHVGVAIFIVNINPKQWKLHRRPILAPEGCVPRVRGSSTDAAHVLGVQSRSVMESAMLMLHSGRPYGTDSSRQRQDHARRPSCYTAIEGFDPRAR